MPKYTFQKFNLDKIAEGSIINVIGKRGSGKSVFIEDLMLFFKNMFPVVTVVSTTDQLNNTFGKHIPAMLIHDNYSSELIENILNRQRRVIEYNKQHPTKQVNPNLLLILDDIQGTTKKIRNDIMLDTIYTTGRHYHITLISAMQYVNGLTPTQRSNTDIICLSRDNNRENQKKLYQAFAGIFNTFAEFQKTFIQLTENHGIMIINNREQSMDLDKCVYWYRVDMNKEGFSNFKMCDASVWRKDEQLRAYKKHSKSKTMDVSSK